MDDKNYTKRRTGVKPKFGLDCLRRNWNQPRLFFNQFGTRCQSNKHKKKRKKYYENILLGNCNVKFLWQRRVSSPGAIWIPFPLEFNVIVDITYFFYFKFFGSKISPEKPEKKLTLAFYLLNIKKIDPRQVNKPCTLCSPELYNYLFLLSSR